MQTVDKRKIFACANQDCGFRVSSDPALGGFCCRGCYAALSSGGPPEHDEDCEQVPAAAFLPRAPANAAPKRGAQVVRPPLWPPTNGTHLCIPAAAKQPRQPQYPPPKKSRITAAEPWWTEPVDDFCEEAEFEIEEEEDFPPVPARPIPCIPKAKAAKNGAKAPQSVFRGIPKAKAQAVPRANEAYAVYEEAQILPVGRIPKASFSLENGVVQSATSKASGASGPTAASASSFFRGVPKAKASAAPFAIYEEDEGESLEEEPLPVVRPKRPPKKRQKASAASEEQSAEEEVMASSVDVEALERKAAERAEERFALGEATLADLKLLGRKKRKFLPCKDAFGFTFCEGIAEDFMVCHMCLQVHGSINEPETLECEASSESDLVVRSFT
ncbi:unnamed protein product [Symbiodinium sp. CCMP2592]|nr:unnamed protein product [Symbiodinium sp. CCMP2592]